MKQIDHTWMPWTSEFKASVNKPVRDGLISPRSNFLLTRRLGRESIFQSELGEICSEKLGTAPLSMAYLFKTLWCKTWNCIVCSIHCHHSVLFFMRECDTSLTLSSKVLMREIRNWIHSLVKSCSIAVSRPGGAGSISKPGIFVYR